MTHDADANAPSNVQRMMDRLRAAQAAGTPLVVTPPSFPDLLEQSKRAYDNAGPATLQLRDRLRAFPVNAGRPPPSYAHLHDPDWPQRITPIVVLDTSADDAEPVKRTRKRKTTLAGVIRQMKRAGVEIAGCEINPRDGAVKIISGKPTEAATPDDIDRSLDPRWN